MTIVIRFLASQHSKMIKLVVLALCASMAFANYYTGGYGGGSGGYSHEPIIIHGSYGGQLGYGGYGRYGKGYGGYGKGIGGYGGFNEGFGYGGYGMDSEYGHGIGYEITVATRLQINKSGVNLAESDYNPLIG